MGENTAAGSQWVWMPLIGFDRDKPDKGVG
jgi:hypothetical protein